jgi:hypothetical protein
MQLLCAIHEEITLQRACGIFGGSIVQQDVKKFLGKVSNWITILSIHCFGVVGN